MGREITNSEAISNLNHIYGIVSSDIQRSLDLAIKALEERPQGEWIITEELKGAGGIVYRTRKCNKCGWENSLVIPRNFCPNCGADMRKGGAE